MITRKELKEKNLSNITIQYLENGFYNDINHISNVVEYILNDRGYVTIYYWKNIDSSYMKYDLSKYVFYLAPGYNVYMYPK
jgi:hypothetical protein